MKTIIKISTAVFFVLLFMCSSGHAKKNDRYIHTNANVKGTAVQFKFMQGPELGKVINIGSFKMHSLPQIALWVEDSNGNFKQNLFVTYRFAKQKWNSIKNNPDSTYRTMSMPYWLNKMIKASFPIPTSAKPLSDAVTAATPDGSFILTTNIDSSIRSGTVWCEINSSFDNNTAYPKIGTNPFNGQPSVIYSAAYNADAATQAPIELVYKGHGGQSGTDGALYPTDSGITTAKQIIHQIEYEIKK